MTDISQAADFIISRGQNANAEVISSFDDDPEQAARAIDLSKASGVPASLIHTDLEGFEKEHKAALTSELLRNNDYLRTYINHDPMASKVSHDDLGQLDAVSERLRKVSALGVAGSFVKGFKEGWGEGPLGQWALERPEDLDYAIRNPTTFLAWKMLGLPIEVPLRTFNAAIQGVSHSVADAAVGITGNEAEGERIKKNIPEMVGLYLTGRMSGQITPTRGMIKAHNEQLKQTLDTLHKEVYEAAKPYLESGQEPPPGIHPVIDKVKSEQATLDAKNLDEALSESQASKTRERAPELYANFIRQHTDAKIGISFDAVRKLYGEKEPVPEDGLLGWVSGIGDQLRSAAATGGDIEIPLADWLARVDPKVAKDLHDDVRVRRQGLTVNEAKELPKASKALEPSIQEEPKPDPILQAVRSQAALKPLTDIDVPISNEAMMQAVENVKGLKGGKWYQLGPDLHAYVKPKEALTAREAELYDTVKSEIDRLVPKGLQGSAGAHSIIYKGRQIRGAYQPYLDQQPLLLWAFDHHNPTSAIGTARHEAIHHLRQYGFIHDTEWDVISKLADTDGWIKKHDIDARYPDLTKEGKLEEAVAEEFKDWDLLSDEKKAEHPTRTVFQRFKELLESITKKVKKLFGVEPKFDNFFDRIDSGEIGSREPVQKPKFGGAQAQEELPGITRQEDLDIFKKASAIGMTKDQYNRYLGLIEKRNAEDAEAQLKKAVDLEKKKQTKEWKENEAKVRDEVKDDIVNRPDIATAQFFTEGVIEGQKLGYKPKLDIKALTEEQKEALPKSYYGLSGINPDDIARHFGYQTGEAMINKLIELEGTRGAMQPKEFLKAIVDQEVDRRMLQRYGDLSENILAEAKDHVISDTQMDLLHEETVALGMKAGAEMPFTKDDVKGWVKDRVGELKVGELDTDKFLNTSGKSGRAAEIALLGEDPTEAFRMKQQQYFSMLFANEAKKFEKEKAGFDRTAKQYSKREVSSTDQEYTNWIHDILSKIGQPIRRSVQDLAESISHQDSKTLEDFVALKEAYLRELPVAEFLYDPAFKKPLDQLSVNEFRAVYDSIKSLVKNGRDELKIMKAGEEADLAEVKKAMIDELTTFKERKYKADEGKLDKLKHVARTYLVSHLQLESLFNRWDRGNPKGPFTQYVMRGLSSAANYEAALERKYSRELKALADDTDLKGLVENNLFADPLTKTKADPDGVMLQLNRKNLRAILLNAGNESNLDKLARGYGVDHKAIVDWLHQNATKEDWKWAQSMGDIFANIKREADTMYRGLTGIEPESIEIKPFDTPHGKMRGWYYPVIFDPIWEGQSKKLMGGDVLEQDNYIRATTPRGYTKQRTSYAAPLSLNLDQVPNRMKQMLHDIAFRPEVINASKVFYDPEIQATITKHYGREYRDLLIPYLRDVANSANYRSDAAKVGTQVSEFLRQNIIATLIGFNPGTVLKHGPTAAINSLTEVGPINFLKAVNGLLEVNDETGERNWTFAMKTSEELQRRHRHYIETLKGANEEVLGTSTLRENMIKAGSAPVAWSDLLSAVPTWMAQYEKSVREGEDHGSAVFMADRSVRRAHGSTAITNRPAMMRGGALSQWVSSLYGFFSHILNRQYELMWKAGDTLGLAKQGELVEAMKRTPELTWGVFSYIIFPALIEELVTPLSNDEKESWGVKGAKILGKGLSSSWIGIRDIAHSMVSGHDPSVGLISSGFHTVTDLVRNLKKDHPMSKQNAANILQHGAAMMGGLTGLVNAQEGKTAKFIYNYSQGLEKPKGPWGWAVGMRYGTLKKHSQTFDEWRKHPL